MTAPRTELDERFPGPDLDRDVWLDSYLPQWSSRAASAATWTIEPDGLHLSIPVDQPLWCPDLHDGPLRVSCLQTGCFAGPVGSTVGQQPFRDDLVVREAQPTWWGCTPQLGTIEVEMRATVTQRSMFAFWLSGIEDRPERSGEICVAEVFGDTVLPATSSAPATADVGMGLHRFRDPALTEDFAAPRLEVDVTEPHVYAVEWTPDRLVFRVDGEQVRTVDQAPDYPVQLMLGVFDFPDRAPEDLDPVPVPEVVVRRVAVRPPA